jgi:pyruvate ferredoxin oxidoreductase gamma subunit
MKEVKIFARAGQGAITTAAIIGEAMFFEDKFAYTYPSFGAARMGAPMNAYLRYDDKPVRLRSIIYSADFVIVIDPTLIESQKCFDGLKPGSKVIVAVREDTVLPKAPEGVTVYPFQAEKIAMEIIGRPFANTILVGAFAKVSGAMSLDAVIKAVEGRFEGKGDIKAKNVEAVKKGYASV